jgi:hypothetical protein
MRIYPSCGSTEYIIHVLRDCIWENYQLLLNLHSPKPLSLYLKANATFKEQKNKKDYGG